MLQAAQCSRNQREREFESERERLTTKFTFQKGNDEDDGCEVLVVSSFAFWT
jgi:hypothetical protein